jgi:hypothetical protein
MKLIFSFVFGLNLLYSSSLGYDTFVLKCQQCHSLSLDKKKIDKNKINLKAPPIAKISQRIKEMIIIKNENDYIHRGVVIAFIKDYIINPNEDKSMCYDNAVSNFGLMPSFKNKITNKENEAVAVWIYDYFEDKEYK